MVGIVYHVASSFAGALWSTTCNLLDALVGFQEPLERRIVDHTQNPNTSSENDQTLDSERPRRRSSQAESSHDFGASSKPIPMKPNNHAASLGHRRIESSHGHLPLKADHFQHLQRPQSMPNLAGPSNQRPHKSSMAGSMIPTIQEPLIDLTHILGNLIISRREKSQLPTSLSTVRGVRFADTKDMQNMTGGRHLGSVTDNEWKASNKTLMKGWKMD
jgi:hypothetical protein